MTTLNVLQTMHLVYKEANKKIEQFAIDNKPDELSIEEFLSMFTWDFELDTNDIRNYKLNLVIRLKTVDELKREIDAKIEYEKYLNMVQRLDDIDEEVKNDC